MLFPQKIAQSPFLGLNITIYLEYYLKVIHDSFEETLSQQPHHKYFGKKRIEEPKMSEYKLYWDENYDFNDYSNINYTQ